MELILARYYRCTHWDPGEISLLLLYDDGLWEIEKTIHHPAHNCLEIDTSTGKRDTLSRIITLSVVPKAGSIRHLQLRQILEFL